MCRLPTTSDQISHDPMRGRVSVSFWVPWESPRDQVKLSGNDGEVAELFRTRSGLTVVQHDGPMLALAMGEGLFCRIASYHAIEPKRADWVLRMGVCWL